MRFLFSTGSLYTYGIDRCFALAAQAGFDGIELMIDGRWDTRQPEYLGELVQRHRQPVYAVHVPLEMDPLPGWPEDTPGRIVSSVALAEALGSRVVTHHLPPRLRLGWVRVGRARLPVPLPGRNSYREWLVGEYPSFRDSVAATLCVENMPRVRLFARAWSLACWNSAAEIVRFPSLTLDTTHLGTWGLDPLEVYLQLRGHVRHVHLSNYDGREHRRPEVGHLRLDRFLARLAADGYDGAVSLELSPDALNAGRPDREVRDLLVGSLAYCRAAAGLP